MFDFSDGINSRAMAPFFARLCRLSGLRRDGVSPRRLAVACPCLVTDGSPADVIGQPSAAGREKSYTIVVRVAGWPDRTGPRTGDLAEIDGLPPLRVTRAARSVDGSDWTIECRSVETAGEEAAAL